MTSNADKCRLLVSTNNNVNTRVENFDIKNSHCETVLGFTFYHKLHFNSHISDLRKKASKKVYVLARVTPYMNVSKRRTKSQFSYWTRVIAVLTIVK